MIRLRVNGAAVEIPSVGTIADVLAALGYRETFLAVARNREHVPRSTFGQTFVHDGDEIEVVAPMAGG